MRTDKAQTALLRALKAYYKTSGRAHLPWRKTHDPYKVLVSEVMLQQTQVERVMPYYKRWLKKFPTAKALAKAKLSDVLTMWQGLGYNRRGKYLWEAAKQLASSASAETSSLSTEFLESLPGVGHYTARAVAAFAYNRKEAFVETNVRTVFFYHLQHTHILKDVSMSDKDLLPLVEDALKKSRMQPRDFYAALMDYGTHLKKQGVRLNTKSKHYAKQSKFEGSTRQKRAAKLRALLAKGASEEEIKKALDSK